jgi:branched-chain amino acid transport system ATP-binding protein
MTSAADVTASKPLLEVSGLQVRYGVAQAVFDVSFAVDAGSVITVLGPNGAGKSTIARALTGLVPISAGAIRFAGDDVTKWTAHRMRRAGIVHLPEGRGVFPGLTVTENLRMAAAVLPTGERKAAVERATEIFPALATRRRQLAGTLSGGEQQMLSLARALMLSPKVIVADELSLGLAPKLVDLVFDSLQQAKDDGVAIVLIEQFVHRALGFSEHCVLLLRGEIAWAGPSTDAKQEVLNRYLGKGAA